MNPAAMGWDVLTTEEETALIGVRVLKADLEAEGIAPTVESLRRALRTKGVGKGAIDADSAAFETSGARFHIYQAPGPDGELRISFGGTL